MDPVAFFAQVRKKRTMPHSLVLEYVSPATRLLEKRRQMFEIQEALEQQKQEFNKREEIFKRREEGLKRKDLDLQESLIRFSKFLQENDSKRSRAEQKAQVEYKTRLQKEKEIEQLQDKLESLQRERDNHLLVLDKNMRYQRYLESVLEATDDYQDIQPLLDRYATLEATNRDLKTHQHKCSELMERTRVDLATYVKQKTDEILNLNNKMSRLKKQLELAETACMSQESQKDYSLQLASQKTLEYGQVVMSTENLYNRTRLKSKIGHQYEANPLAQLEVVGNFVMDLGHIIKLWREKGRKELAGQQNKQH